MDRHDYIRQQIIQEEIEADEEKINKDGKSKQSYSTGGAKGVRLLEPEDEGWS